MSTSLQPLPEELLGEMEREGFSWKEVFAEVIDNSLDARATQILITITRDFVEIADNGEGCSHPENMLQKGFSSKRGKTGMTGRYGIGLKHASFYICRDTGDTCIETTHGGVTRTVIVNWGQLISNRNWEIPDPVSKAALETTKGTSIQFRRGKRKFLSDQQFMSIIDDLQFTFAPALSKGCRITFMVNNKRTQLEPPPQPEYAKSIDRIITVGKKTVKLTAGIVANGVQNRRKGLSYLYAHRNILSCTASGCGGYPIANISGTVELGDTWKLGQNKKEVTDDDFDKLCRSVLREMEPMLQEAAKLSQDVATEKIKLVLEDGINSVFGRALRPGKTGKKGTVEPKGTKRKVKNSAVVGGVGRVVGRTFGGTGDFTIEMINDEDEFACRVDLTGRRVTLNRYHHEVAAAYLEKNYLSLFILVNSHVIHAVQCSGERQKYFPSMEQSTPEEMFAMAMTEAMSRVSSQQLSLLAAPEKAMDKMQPQKTSA